jgi:peptide chain release factor 2
MRADAQALVDRIDAALNLVKMSLDWDRALRRLDELNARVEDPKLWDNPKDAEAVMKERGGLMPRSVRSRTLCRTRPMHGRIVELAKWKATRRHRRRRGRLRWPTVLTATRCKRC